MADGTGLGSLFKASRMLCSSPALPVGAVLCRVSQCATEYIVLCDLRREMELLWVSLNKEEREELDNSTSFIIQAMIRMK